MCCVYMCVFVYCEKETKQKSSVQGSQKVCGSKGVFVFCFFEGVPNVNSKSFSRGQT